MRCYIYVTFLKEGKQEINKEIIGLKCAEVSAPLATGLGIFSSGSPTKVLVPWELEQGLWHYSYNFKTTVSVQTAITGKFIAASAGGKRKPSAISSETRRI